MGRSRSSIEGRGRGSWLLLAPQLDAAFDRGFMTVEDDGRVVVSHLLSPEDRRLLWLEREAEDRAACRGAQEVPALAPGAGIQAVISARKSLAEARASESELARPEGAGLRPDQLQHVVAGASS